MLQWRYIAGNNWGMCEDGMEELTFTYLAQSLLSKCVCSITGTGAVGCGPQEEFRACSDVSIGNLKVAFINIPKCVIKIFNYLR